MKRQWDMTGFCMEQTTTNMPFGIKNAPVFNVYSDENGGEFLVQKLYVEIADAIRGEELSLRNSNNYIITHYALRITH